MSKRKSIKVVYSALKNVYGWCHFDKGYIELDKTLKGKKLLEIMLHESIHMMFPDMPGDQVVKISVTLTHTLWNEGFRKIDNDDSAKLQDELKIFE